MNFLETEDVVKQYANHLALDKVSIQVPEGQIFGLLGPNGAGKSTTLKMINRLVEHPIADGFFSTDGSRNQTISIRLVTCRKNVGYTKK